MARTAFFAFLYAALAAFASPAAADLSAEEIAALKEMRVGYMEKLVFHAKPRPLVAAAFVDGAGGETRFADFTGKITVVNFWATWCPPCRKEMPGLDRLHAAIAGEGFDVIAINIERRGRKKAARFYKQIDLQSLAIHADEKGAVSSELGLLGYPVTIILDRNGREIARMQGDAEWDSPEARAILDRLSGALPRPGEG